MTARYSDSTTEGETNVNDFIWWLHPYWLVVFLCIRAIVGWL